MFKETSPGQNIEISNVTARSRPNLLLKIGVPLALAGLAGFAVGETNQKDNTYRAVEVAGVSAFATGTIVISLATLHDRNLRLTAKIEERRAQTESQ